MYTKWQIAMTRAGPSSNEPYNCPERDEMNEMECSQKGTGGGIVTGNFVTNLSKGNELIIDQ